MSMDNGDPWTPIEEPQKKNRKPLVVIAIATAAVVVIGGLGTAAIAELTQTPSSSTSSTATPGSPFGQFHEGSGYGGFGGGGFGQGQIQGGESAGEQAVAGETAAVPATAAQKVGLVVIDTALDYTPGDEAAGTGMIISSDGYILTNNHVVESSTSIRVTVESTGKTYSADVVGTDATADVAILKLVGASGLSTVKFAPTAKVKVGESIYSVGNAEGTGTLLTAVGTVGATNESLKVGSDSASQSESLTGLIELESDVVSGDSGGPLYDKSGDVIGIVTAASSGTANVTGYAINIAQVLTAAKSIESGISTADVVIGYPAFLGIDIAADTTTEGVPVAATFPGLPAAKAGIVRGDIITAVNGTPATSADQLSSLITSYKVGERVTVSWRDADGAAHSTVVTLAAGPAA